MKKKLIEVALPLEAINVASAREKSIRHGHPSTLHLWWARRPLAACRAVLFASLVDDPSSLPEEFPTEEAQEVERQRLFRIIERLVKWENSNNPEVLAEAHAEIRKSCLPPLPPDNFDLSAINEEAHKFDGYEAYEKDNPGGDVWTFFERHQRQYYEEGQWRGTLRELRILLFTWFRNHRANSISEVSNEEQHAIRNLYKMIRAQWSEVEPDIPPVLDPFCGGGSIPLEAQRLGLEAHGSDLNPVPVLITKALIEIPPKFAGQPPINPEARGNLGQSGTWTGATGLAEDVRYYGKWMRDEAEKRIGHLYPKVMLPKEQGGGEATVIAWIWARTVKCPNPACGIQMPLVRSFVLSTKVGKSAWIEPDIDENVPRVRFTVKMGSGKPREGTVSKRGAVCIRCGTPVILDYVRTEAKGKRMNAQLMAIVADGKYGRIYLSPTSEHEAIAISALPAWKPDELVTTPSHDVDRLPMYGMTAWGDAFTARQLVSMTTFSQLVGEACEQIKQHGKLSGLPETSTQFHIDAVATYLALGVSRLSDACNSLCGWSQSGAQSTHLFARQVIPMKWDYSEANVFGNAAGDFGVSLHNLLKALVAIPMGKPGTVEQRDARTAVTDGTNFLYSTDPPYYDNIGYADLSDFFYVWLRRMLQPVYSGIFSTMLTPKSQELIASPPRFNGSRMQASRFFEDGLREVFRNMRMSAHPDFPVTIFYAFKQSENEEDADDNLVSVTASTGWETMLQGLIDAGFQITGTWPMRTERPMGVKSGSNVLASSIVLVCRPRPEDAPISTRREFVTALRGELEAALITMMHGNIAPVDLAQATIGPGMAVYSRYSKVIETNGEPLRVRTALQIINQELDTILSATEGDYDGDTRFCLAWFEQFGMNAGVFGDADNMARAKNTSVAGLAEAGVLASGVGKVRLLKREEYPADWNPQADTRKPVWEATQYLVRALETGGEGAAARLCKMLGSGAEPARDLAYRLYSICERKGWPSEALAYNSLVIAWPEITRLASNPNILITATGLFAESEL